MKSRDDACEGNFGFHERSIDIRPRKSVMVCTTGTFDLCEDDKDIMGADVAWLAQTRLRD